MKIIKKLGFSFSKQLLSDPTFTKLQNRGIIMIGGPETKKFLQGLTTNNVQLLYQKNSTGPKRVAIYSLFLGPKGKVITDAIIFRPIIISNGKKESSEDQLWIDVSKETSTVLFEHLRKYTWKKNVQIQNLSFDEEKPDIHAGFNKYISELIRNKQSLASAGTLASITQADKFTPEEQGGYCNIGYIDPRNPFLGIRMVCNKAGFEYRGASKQKKLVTEQQYQKNLTSFGVTSSKMMMNKLPFMFNPDLFNGFSFNKGCYLGQQIVARGYHTGVVRRRIFPYHLADSQLLQVGQALMDQNNTQIGKVFESYPGYGTVLCNYLPLMQKQWPLKILKPFGGQVTIPFQDELKAYLKQMSEKQAKMQLIDI